MNTVSVLCLVVVLLLIAGCQTEHIWVKDGASQKEFKWMLVNVGHKRSGHPKCRPSIRVA